MVSIAGDLHARISPVADTRCGEIDLIAEDRVEFCYVLFHRFRSHNLSTLAPLIHELSSPAIHRTSDLEN